MEIIEYGRRIDIFLNDITFPTCFLSQNAFIKVRHTCQVDTRKRLRLALEKLEGFEILALIELERFDCDAVAGTEIPC